MMASKSKTSKPSYLFTGRPRGYSTSNLKSSFLKKEPPSTFSHRRSECMKPEQLNFDKEDSEKILVNLQIPPDHIKSSSLISEASQANPRRVHFGSLNRIIRSCDSLHKNVDLIKRKTSPVSIKNELRKIDNQYLLIRFLDKRYFQQVRNLISMQKDAVAKAKREINDNAYFVSKLGARKIWKFNLTVLSKKQEEDIRIFQNDIY